MLLPAGSHHPTADTVSTGTTVDGAFARRVGVSNAVRLVRLDAKSLSDLRRFQLRTRHANIGPERATIWLIAKRQLLRHASGAHPIRSSKVSVSARAAASALTRCLRSERAPRDPSARRAERGRQDHSRSSPRGHASRRPIQLGRVDAAALRPELRRPALPRQSRDMSWPDLGPDSPDHPGWLVGSAGLEHVEPIAPSRRCRTSRPARRDLSPPPCDRLAGHCNPARGRSPRSQRSSTERRRRSPPRPAIPAARSR